MDREDLLPTPPTGSALPTVLADRYRLERSLGNGGMGEVFEAADLMLDRSVAVKLMAHALVQDAPARKRFLREARALAQVNSPNVVAVYDAGEDAERPYLVMELVEGTTLQQELWRNGRIETARAVAIATGMAGGLAAAHARGIVHRDVKPSNVFLTPSDMAKIGDFGIARLERPDATLTLTGQTFGSPPYMAPEQATGGAVDARADLYALGCVLFQMLAGRRPFPGDDAVSLVYQHVHTIPPRVDDLDPGVPPALGALVAGLMAKDPADRPGTADEVRTALAGVSTAAPLPAAEGRTRVLPRRTQELEKRRRRRWPIALVVAGVLASLALATTAILAGGERAAAPSPTQAASTRPPSVSTSPPTSPPVTVVAPTTTEAAAGALIGLTQQLSDAGTLDHKLAGDIQHTVDEIVNGHGHGDEGDMTDKLVELKDAIAESADHGKLSTADAKRLNDAIDQLQRTLGSGD